MRQLLSYIIVALSILLQCISADAQQSAPSLAELIDSAIKKNYTLDNQVLDIELSGLDRQRLKDEYLPRIKVEGSDGFVLTSISLSTPAIKAGAIDLSDGRKRLTATSNVMGVSTEASMLIYSGGKVPLLKKSLDEKIKGQTHFSSSTVRNCFSNQGIEQKTENLKG